MSELIRHRRGDTFEREGTWAVNGAAVALTGYAIDCVFYNPITHAVLASVSGVPDADQVARRGVFTYEVDTSSWADRSEVTHFVRFTSPNGNKKSSPNVTIVIVEEP